LTFRWTETGGPPVGLPKRQGFGARVMERIIEGQLNGELKFDWRKEGVVCEAVIDT
jgi:two-component sensor histidine kinase